MARSSTSGQGRPKGSLNKPNHDIRQMIVGALDLAGGVHYLARQAEANPVAFMGLIGKVMPLQVTGRDGAPIAVDFRWADASGEQVATAVITPVIEAKAEPSDEGELIEWQAPELAND